MRTKAQNKIDNRIKLFFGDSSCDVWVKVYNGVWGGGSNYEEPDMIDVSPGRGNSKKDEEFRCTQSIDFSEKLSQCFPDPLLLDMLERLDCWEDQGRVDPIVLNEYHICSMMLPADNSRPHQYPASPRSIPNLGSNTSRPRGRPRKSSIEQKTL